MSARTIEAPVTRGEVEARYKAAERESHASPHVLTITPFYPKEGNEQLGCFVAEPLQELIRVGVRSTVVAADPFYRGSPKASLVAPRADWLRYPSLPGGFGLASAGFGLYWRLVPLVRDLHRRAPIDLIHAHGALPCGQASALLSRQFKIPYVVTVHGLDAFSSAQVGGKAGEWCIGVSRRVYEGASRVLGVSKRVCDEVLKRAKAGATSVVYNGVDAGLFRPGYESPSPVLLTVGNLIPSKGHALLVRALAALRPEFSSLRWDVIGEGPELGNIRHLARELGVLGSIRFLGRRSRNAVAEACARCTVFVLPSRYEGLGCVYLEAMACHKVAIGCLGQGIDEVIRHGENGWLIRPDRLADLVEGLRILLGNTTLRRRIGLAARDTILHGFTLQHQAQSLMAVYGECLR